MVKKRQPRDKRGRFMKPSKRRSPKKKPIVKRQPPRRKLTSSRITKRQQFIQRYFIDKFKRDGQTEWEIFTIEVRGTKKGEPLKTKKKMIAKVKEIVR